MMRFACTALLFATACLEVQDPEAPMCTSDSDCDSGEICEEHTCYGNPPVGPFAAVVSPPSERGGELVSTEILELPIAGDGWLGDVHLDSTLTYTGRLQMKCEPPQVCDDRMLGASITVTRKTSFDGGPGFRKVVTVDPGAATFELKLPATTDPLRPYVITIVPDGRDTPGSGNSTAQQVPPLRMPLELPGTPGGTTLELGGLYLPRISGLVTNSVGAPLANYRVVALGHWESEQAPTEVSTVDFTGLDGTYSITLSDKLIDNVEIVARPFGNPLRPTLHLGSIPAYQSAVNRVLALPTPTAGNELAVDVVVDHKETGGEITRVAGARVVVSGMVATGQSSRAKLVAEGTTDDNGLVTLKLLDTPALAETYKLSVVPPPNSKAAALFDKPFAPYPLTVQRLGTRIAIVGVVQGPDGEPVQDVSVTVRPSVRFLWSLEAAPQAFLGAIPAATVITPNTGEFVLFVDHAFANVTAGQAGTVWGHYDLTFEPTASARAASWIRTDVELPRDAEQEVLDLGQVPLPDAAYTRGYVYDAEGTLLEGAEVKLYRVLGNHDLCTETRFEPTTCPIPAPLLGRGASDKDGVVRLTLPRSQ